MVITMSNRLSEIRALTMLVISYIQENVSTSHLQSALISASTFDATDCIEAYDQLKNEGLIDESSHDGNDVCCLTEKGSSILPEISAFIPDGIREDFIKSAWRYYEALLSGVEYFSSVRHAKDGYYLDTGVKVNGKTTVSASVYFEAEKEAYEAKKNYDTRPQAVTNAILSAITGNVDFMVQ